MESHYIGRKPNATCLYCKKPFATNRAYMKRGGAKYCTVSCMRKYKIEHRAINIDSGGYLYITEGRIHRLIMEKHLGRKLLRTEHVHHINGNKRDNSINNLEILEESEHHKRHSTQGLNLTKECIVCGKEFHTIKSDYKNRSFCSLPCYWVKKKGTWRTKFRV